MWGQYWSVKNTILGLFDIEQACQLLQPYIMNTILVDNRFLNQRVCPENMF